MEKIEEKLVDYLIRNNVIEMEQKEVYKYCVGTILEIGTFIFIVVTSGIILNQFVTMLIFLGYFFICRGNAGGFHANSYLKCFIMSVSAYSIVLFTEISTCVRIGYPLGNLIFLICSAGQIILAPVDTPNKPVNDKNDIKKAKITVAVTTVFFELVYWIICYINIPGRKAIVACSVIVFVSQVAGKIEGILSKHD